MVARTGFGREKDKILARAAGFDYHITKPATLDCLETLLSDMPKFSPDSGKNL